jgi:DNA-binding PadR family transcriptional regulator
LRAEWGEAETGREAKFYALTKLGCKQLDAETANWDRLSEAVTLILRTAQ